MTSRSVSREANILRFGVADMDLMLRKALRAEMRQQGIGIGGY